MDADQRPERFPAPYGSACEECQRSKCKCMLQAGRERCVRCDRLDQACRPSQGRRRRNNGRVSGIGIARTPTEPSKGKRLEQKLDELTQLVRLGMLPGSASRGATGDSVITPDSSNSGNGSQAPGDTSSRAQSWRPWIDTSIGTADLSDPQSTNDAGPTPVEAEECLENYKHHNAKYLPFVYIPSSMTARQLRKDRPFLWLCIMAIATRSTSSLRSRSRKIRELLADEMIMKSEKSVDLLMGLLVFVSWFQHQYDERHRFPMPMFVGLAISIVGDIGLNKAPEDIHIPFCVNAHPQPPPLTHRTNEDRRAVLGCFYISSVISASLQRVEALRWTPYMAECLRVLEEQREAPTDEALVQLIKLQLLVEKANVAAWYDQMFETPERLKTPPYLHAESLASQLGEYKAQFAEARQERRRKLENSFPNGMLEGQAIIDLHVLTTELIIYEVALSRTPRMAAISIGDQGSNYQRRRYLDASLETIAAWFRVFMQVPIEDYVGFTFSLISQLIRCLALLYHLSTCEDQRWDRNHVRETIDLLQVLDVITEKTAQVSAVAGADNSGCKEAEVDVFTRTARRFWSLRPSWAAALGRGDEQFSATAHSFGAQATIEEHAFELDSFNLDWLDDDWLMNYTIQPT